MQAQPQLRFDGFWVHHLDFTHTTTKKDGEYNINLHRDIKYPNLENKNLFQLVFTIVMQNTDTNPAQIILNLTVVGGFEMIGELSEEVIKTFQEISAPTIVFPYIRALISTVTLQFGLNPITLPVMSFIPQTGPTDK